MSAPEFSRPVGLDTLGPLPREMAIEADADERQALAVRFGLLAIDRLAARFSLSREGEVVVAEGWIGASATQACVASGSPVAAVVDAQFALRFVPERAEREEELELGRGDLDTVEYGGARIDLGEAVAQDFALALDPFPRAPEADSALRAAGVLTEQEAEETRRAASPFAELKALKHE